MGPRLREDDTEYVAAASRSNFDLSPWPAQLRRQPVHRARDIAPLREPASRKTKRQVRAVDAALAEAHAGRCGVAGTARDHGRRAGKEQVFIAVRRAVAERARGQAVVSLRRNLFEIARIDGA